MSEVWLHANRRLFVGPILVAAIAAGALAMRGAVAPSGLGWWIAAVAALALALVLFMWSRRPRLAFDGRSLLLYIRNGSAIAVPIEFVEAFLLGKGPTYLSGKDDYKTEARTLIIRIAERAEEFAKLETNVRLAAWCGHYVTLRGTWTEPLDIDLVNRLNQRLYDTQQKLKNPPSLLAPCGRGAGGEG
ncbi:MAG: hypothetical protein C0483_16655 [Pirellula sp.]|nr:hypothetical protein [Pirellula sp.]